MSMIKKMYNKLNYVIEFILSILLGICLLKIGYIKETIGVIGRMYFILSCAIAALILIIIVINFRIEKEKIEKKFLSIVIPIGMLILMLLIPYQAPDEAPHIIRAYEVYHGGFIAKLDSEGKHRAIVPKALESLRLPNICDYKTLHEQLNQKTNYQETAKSYTEAQSYPATLYLFSGLGLKIGQIFNLNLIVSMYLGRICNFLVFLILAYFSVKLIPFGKLALSAYLLMPMVLQQAASSSPDCLINSITIFFIVYIMSLMFDKKELRKRDITVLVAMSIFIGISKMVYFPVVALLVLLLANKDLPKKKTIVVVVICILLSLLSSILWYNYQGRYTDEREYVAERNINSTEQVKYILGSPIGYMKILGSTMDKMGIVYVYGLVGDCLGWQSIQINQLLILVYIILLMLAPFFEEHKESFDWKQKLFIALILLGTILLIFTGLYIGWSEVGNSVVVGVQGRYFVPIAILGLLIMCLKENFIKTKRIDILYFVMISVIDISVVLTILQYFIG